MVSVIIPTYNRAGLISRAVDSVVGQSFRDWELIVVDDGSTDDTRSLLSGYHDSRIRYLPISHGGPSTARNAGIGLARFPYLAFLDSDDSWEPSKLQRQLEALEDNPQYQVVYTNEKWIRNGKRVNQKKKHRKYGGWIYRNCLPLCIISPSSILMSREVLERIGPFDESYPVCEDYEMWLRLSATFPVLFLDELLITKYGGHEDQLSRSTWGFDEFRVRALTNMLTSGSLPWQARAWTAEEIVNKAGILSRGFLNRGKPGKARQYMGIVETWRQFKDSWKTD